MLILVQMQIFIAKVWQELIQKLIIEKVLISTKLHVIVT